MEFATQNYKFVENRPIHGHMDGGTDWLIPDYPRKHALCKRQMKYETELCLRNWPIFRHPSESMIG